jgi:hypothetical protein
MAWLGLRRGGWPGLAMILALAAAPCVASAQEAALTELAPLNAVGPLAVPMFAAAPSADSPVAPGFDDRGRALDCMSMAIAYEAAGQPVAGQEAVGQVILNRLRAARFPKTVCGVVFQGSERLTGCQFTFTCDGSFRRRLTDTTLITARSIAATVLDGVAPDRVAGATHYHADYVLPYWAASGQRVARIGAHIFYRMPRDAGRAMRAASLTQAEPEMAAFRRFAGHRHGARLAQIAPAAPHALFAPWGLPVAAAQR